MPATRVVSFHQDPHAAAHPCQPATPCGTNSIMSVRVGPYAFDRVSYDPADILRLGDTSGVGGGDTPEGDAWFYPNDTSQEVAGLEVMWPKKRVQDDGALFVTLPAGERVEAAEAVAAMRDQLVLQAMEDLGIGRQEAEFVVSVELGETDGDEIATSRTRD